ncbi:MAG: transcriptional regulator [Janthinobacterium lividum]
MDLKTYLREKRGRQASLAKAIGAHAPDISKWASGIRPIPAERCMDIEEATNGALRCEDLLPLAKWYVLRASPRRKPRKAGRPESSHETNE